MRLLAERSLFPVNVAEASGATSGGGGRKIKLRHLTTYYQQMADLLRAGVPMMRALEVLSTQDGAPQVLKNALAEVREDVAGGETLAEAMEKHPSLFKNLHCSMIRAGERGGFLEDVLERLAVFSEKQDELQNKLVGAMIYPAILMIAAVIIVTLIMVVVVPKLRDYLKPETFNVMTVIVFAACDVIMLHYGWLLGILVGLIASVVTLGKTEFGSDLKARIQLNAPMFGPIYRAVSVSRFCRILGTLLQNGVPILQSLKISQDSAGNPILAAEIEKAAENVRRGEALSTPLGESGLVPGDILSMIAVAEESNNLDNVLVQIAETQEARTGRVIETAVRLVEPLLLAGMAVVVGSIAFALLLPILQLGTTAN